MTDDDYEYDIFGYGDFARYVTTLRRQCNIFDTKPERDAFDYAMKIVLDFFKESMFLGDEWILMSEEMPPLYTPVWMTLRCTDCDPEVEDDVYVLVCEIKKNINGAYEAEEYFEGWPSCEFENCIAWKPYYEPTPYHGRNIYGISE